MADIDVLNDNVAQLTQSVADLGAEVAAITPAAPVDLSGATAGVAAAKAAVDQAVSDLKAKFPA